jgi:hypothetical protein
LERVHAHHTAADANTVELIHRPFTPETPFANHFDRLETVASRITAGHRVVEHIAEVNDHSKTKSKIFQAVGIVDIDIRCFIVSVVIIVVEDVTTI